MSTYLYTLIQRYFLFISDAAKYVETIALERRTDKFIGLFFRLGGAMFLLFVIQLGAGESSWISLTAEIIWLAFLVFIILPVGIVLFKRLFL